MYKAPIAVKRDIGTHPNEGVACAWRKQVAEEKEVKEDALCEEYIQPHEDSSARAHLHEGH
jgi:hypothetical protein